MYSCEESTVGLRSRVQRVDIRSGRAVVLREYSQGDALVFTIDLSAASEPPEIISQMRKIASRSYSQLISLRVSRLEQYFVMLLKDRTPELWDLRTVRILCVSVINWEKKRREKKKGRVLKG